MILNYRYSNLFKLQFLIKKNSSQDSLNELCAKTIYLFFETFFSSKISINENFIIRLTRFYYMNQQKNKLTSHYNRHEWSIFLGIISQNILSLTLNLTLHLKFLNSLVKF